MGFTITQSDHQVRNVASGRITATSTPAAISSFSVGFQPRYVRVSNVSERVQLEWYENMTAAHALKTVAAGTRTKITSLGITVSASGFSIGLDTDLQPTHGVSSNENLLDFYAIG